MTSWEILDVQQREPRDPSLVGCHLDSPKAGITEGNPLVIIAGWVLERGGPALAVELSHAGDPPRRVAMNQLRPDLAAAFPEIREADKGGFRTAIGAAGLEEHDLNVRAVLQDQSRVLIGSIRLRRACTEESKNGPKVSVVIPCYKHAHFLGTAIESVLGQTYANVEIVVVDDGSPDNAAAVARQYPGIVYVRQENGGLSDARNTGIRTSSGNYLMFLDADDRLLPEAVQAGLQCFHEHPQCAFVSGQFCFIGADGKVCHVPELREVGEDRFREFLRLNYVSMHGTVMYRRDTLQEAAGFDTRLRSCEDYDLYLRVARNHPVACHDRVVAEYRRHGDNMSGNAARMIKFALAVLNKQREIVRGNRAYCESFRRGKEGWRQYYGEQLLAEVGASLEGENWRKAGQALLALLRYHPHGLVAARKRRVAGQEV